MDMYEGLAGEYKRRFKIMYRSYDAATSALVDIWEYSTDEERVHFEEILRDLRSRQSRLFNEYERVAGAISEAVRSSS